MRTSPSFVAVGLLALSILYAPIPAGAADLSRNVVVRSSSARGCSLVRRCGPAGCGWRQICARVCTEGISCSSLYGAYGPDGGTLYWGAYTLGW